DRHRMDLEYNHYASLRSIDGNWHRAGWHSFLSDLETKQTQPSRRISPYSPSSERRAPLLHFVRTMFSSNFSPCRVLLSVLFLSGAPLLADFARSGGFHIYNFLTAGHTLGRIQSAAASRQHRISGARRLHRGRRRSESSTPGDGVP